ncbi:MAG: YIP1 family protein [Candidatus Undinarchaeales archaeon]|jgi:hypothetical protein|nr:YIP1 family protein [Candidatus Undinarchaeales archaeon]
MDIPNIKNLLLKPKTAFNELLLEANWKRGFGAWFLFSLIGTAVFFLLGAGARSTYIIFDFGLGTGYANVLVMGIFFIQLFVFFLSSTTFYHFGAKLLKGTGTYGTTIGLMGYTNILMAVKGLFSGLLTIIRAQLINYSVKTIMVEGTMNAGAFSILNYLTIAGVIIFGVWTMWLQSVALSVAHQIKIWKGFAVVLLVSILFILIQGWLA